MWINLFQNHWILWAHQRKRGTEAQTKLPDASNTPYFKSFVQIHKLVVKLLLTRFVIKTIYKKTLCSFTVVPYLIGKDVSSHDITFATAQFRNALPETKRKVIFKKPSHTVFMKKILDKFRESRGLSRNHPAHGHKVRALSETTSQTIKPAEYKQQCPSRHHWVTKWSQSFFSSRIFSLSKKRH